MRTGSMGQFPLRTFDSAPIKKRVDRFKLSVREAGGDERRHLGIVKESLELAIASCITCGGGSTYEASARVQPGGPIEL